MWQGEKSFRPEESGFVTRNEYVFFFFFCKKRSFLAKTSGNFLASRYRVTRGDRRARREDSFYIKNRISLVARREYLLQELK